MVHQTTENPTTISPATLTSISKFSIILTAVQYVFKTVFQKSSFYENKVLSQNLSKLTPAKVPCFHRMKNTVSKMNGFQQNVFIFKFVSLFLKL